MPPSITDIEIGTPRDDVTMAPDSDDLDGTHVDLCDEEDDGDITELDVGQIVIPRTVKRKPGRPLGSKNKPKNLPTGEGSTSTIVSTSSPPQTKRKRGRPPKTRTPEEQAARDAKPKRKPGRPRKVPPTDPETPSSPPRKKQRI